MRKAQYRPATDGLPALKEAGMATRGARIGALILLINSTVGIGAAQQNGSVRAIAQQESNSGRAAEVVVAGHVEHVYAPHLFTIARSGGDRDRPLIVFAPTAAMSPDLGSGLTARGTLRTCDDADVKTAGGCDQLADSANADFSSRPVLLARSLITTRGRELTGRVPRSPNAAAIQAAPAERFELHNEFPLTMHPEMLAALADALAGGSVQLPRARVVGVFSPRVFLIETQTSMLPAIQRDRVLVFIESGSLRVDPAVLVASTVTVSGVARTLLGMRTNYDVPWPAALTQDAVKHLDIKAAVLARSVRTPEGIDLVTRSSSGAPADREPAGSSPAVKER
jgi:hypothetical protein